MSKNKLNKQQQRHREQFEQFEEPEPPKPEPLSEDRREGDAAGMPGLPHVDGSQSGNLSLLLSSDEVTW